MADRQSVPNNIYTVLTLVALLALLAGVAFVLYRSDQLFGTMNPLEVKDLSALLPAGLTGFLG